MTPPRILTDEEFDAVIDFLMTALRPERYVEDDEEWREPVRAFIESYIVSIGPAGQAFMARTLLLWEAEDAIDPEEGE